MLVNYQLLQTPDYLGLQKKDGKALPLYVDFLSGKIRYRQQHTSLRKETLARALGLKNHTQPRIVDATAGLGRDSFILASFGFEITLLERSPTVHALLADGINRALRCPEIAPIVERLHLIHTDALSWLQAPLPSDQPDIIYLDPTFPERHKSALVKKDMRIFHEVVGDDPDADALLTTALTCAVKRVVVKRPRLADPLGDKTPTYCLTEKSCRFDVYLR